MNELLDRLIFLYHGVWLLLDWKMHFVGFRIYDYVFLEMYQVWYIDINLSIDTKVCELISRLDEKKNIYDLYLN